MQILNDVFQIAGPLYAVHQNIYIVKGEKSLVMIDTGADDRELAVADSNLSYWGLSKFPISHVLITHAHYEHSANAHILRERGAIIVACDGDAQGIELGDDRTAYYAFINRTPFIPCPVDIKVKGQEIIKVDNLEFEVIHAPGHSAGSVIYRFEKEGKVILFTGDTILTKEICRESAHGWTGGMDYDREQYLHTLQKLSLMNADIVLPGHSDLCMRDAAELLRDAYMKFRLRFCHVPVSGLSNDLARRD